MDKTFNNFNSKTKIHDDLLNYLIEKTKDNSIVWSQDYTDALEPETNNIYYTNLDMPLQSKEELVFYPIFDKADIKALVPGINISICKEYDITITNFKVKMYIITSLNNNEEITIEDTESYSKGEQGFLIKLYETIEDKEKYINNINEEKVWKHISYFLDEQK